MERTQVAGRAAAATAGQTSFPLAVLTQQPAVSREQAGRSRWPGPAATRPPEGIAIRPACGTDVGALRDFLAGLSPRSRYQRFFTGAPPVSTPFLRILAGAGDNIDVVVASAVSGDAVSGDAVPGDAVPDPTGPNGEATIIGHAMAVDSLAPGAGERTEIGVVVADACQSEGVGSALVRALAGRAGARGIRSLEMDVLAENRRVLAMIARRWPGARYERRGAYVTVRAMLP